MAPEDTRRTVLQRGAGVGVLSLSGCTSLAGERSNPAETTEHTSSALAGQVLDPANAGVESILTLYDRSEDATAIRAQVRSDADGRYRFPDVELPAEGLLTVRGVDPELFGTLSLSSSSSVGDIHLRKEFLVGPELMTLSGNRGIMLSAWRSFDPNSPRQVLNVEIVEVTRGTGDSWRIARAPERPPANPPPNQSWIAQNPIYKGGISVRVPESVTVDYSGRSEAGLEEMFCGLGAFGFDIPRHDRSSVAALEDWHPVRTGVPAMSIISCEYSVLSSGRARREEERREAVEGLMLLGVGALLSASGAAGLAGILSVLEWAHPFLDSQDRDLFDQSQREVRSPNYNTEDVAYIGRDARASALVLRLPYRPPDDQQVPAALQVNTSTSTEARFQQSLELGPYSRADEPGQSQDAYEIVDHTMCKRVDPETLEPIGRTDRFTTDDEHTVFWIRHEDIRTDLTWDVEYHSPTGESFGSVSWTEIVPDAGYDRYIYLDRRTISPRMPAGEWTCTASVNGNPEVVETYSLDHV